MLWSFATPKTGDMLRVKINEYYHYGVCVGEDEVIQFGLAPIARTLIKDCDVEICTSNVSQFLCGGILEVGTPEDSDGTLRSVDEIVSYARARLGEKGYSILHNNCEHFAYECLFGVKKSTQTDFVRAYFRSLPLLDVYTAQIPNEVKDSEMDLTNFQLERVADIESCQNQRVKTEKYFVWKLLEHALNRSLGLKIEKINFIKQSNGKWTCENCKFSLSHSNGVVAVAISRLPVGIDVEQISLDKAKVIKKVLTDSERQEEIKTLTDNDCQVECLITKWCEKESIFKAGDSSGFNPKNIETKDALLKSKKIVACDKEYILTVCSQNISALRYFDNVKL